MPDKYIEEVLKTELAILDIDKELKKKYSKSDGSKSKDSSDDELEGEVVEIKSGRKMRSRTKKEDKSDGLQAKDFSGKESEEDVESDAGKKGKIKNNKKEVKLDGCKSKDVSDHEFEEPNDEIDVGKTGKIKNKKDVKPSQSHIKKMDKGKDVQIVKVTATRMKQNSFEVETWLQERDILVLPVDRRPDADFTITCTVSNHSYSLWGQIEKDISSCRGNYTRVSNICRSHYVALDRDRRVIKSLFNKRLTWDNQDMLAHSLIPRDGNLDRSEAFEIMTRAVGDCLLDAISRLVYGNQNHARELRTRMTVEAVVYEEWYLLDKNLGVNLPALDTGHSLTERYALYAGTQAKNFASTYQKEVIRCFKSGQYCALWQIHQLSTIIGRPIICLFPEFEDLEDEAPLRFYHNRTIYPREVSDHANESVTIMWTKSSPMEESQQVANHIVPVVKKYPVTKVLFCGTLEPEAPTDEHVFFYENSAEEQDVAQDISDISTVSNLSKKQLDGTKEMTPDTSQELKDASRMTSHPSDSNRLMDKVKKTAKPRKQTSRRGRAKQNSLPRTNNFVTMPGYSVKSDEEIKKRNQDLAKRNREALEAMKQAKECTVTLQHVPMEGMTSVTIGKTDRSDQPEVQPVLPQMLLMQSEHETESALRDEEAFSLEKSEAKEEPTTQLNEQTPTDNTHETGGALREEEGSSLDKPEDKELPDLSESIPLVETQEQTTELNEQTPTKKIHEREGASSELDGALVTTSFDNRDALKAMKQAKECTVTLQHVPMEGMTSVTIGKTDRSDQPEVQPVLPQMLLMQSEHETESALRDEEAFSLEKSEAKEEPTTQLNEQTPTDNTHETGGALREEEGSSLEKSEDKEEPTTQLNEQTPTDNTHETGGALREEEGSSLDKPEDKDPLGALREEEGSSLDKPEDKEYSI